MHFEEKAVEINKNTKGKHVGAEVRLFKLFCQRQSLL